MICINYLFICIRNKLCVIYANNLNRYNTNTKYFFEKLAFIFPHFKYKIIKIKK